MVDDLVRRVSGGIKRTLREFLEVLGILQVWSRPRLASVMMQHEYKNTNTLISSGRPCTLGCTLFQNYEPTRINVRQWFVQHAVVPWVILVELQENLRSLGHPPILTFTTRAILCREPGVDVVVTSWSPIFCSSPPQRWIVRRLYY